jgi:ribosomal protein L24E
MSQVRLHQNIAGYRFEGPYLGNRRIPQGSGLFAIVSYDGKQYYLLDVGYAKNINRSCRMNPRKTCWEKNRHGNIHFAFLQDDSLDEQAYRLIIEEIRKRYKKIPCGQPKV